MQHEQDTARVDLTALTAATTPLRRDELRHRLIKAFQTGAGRPFADEMADLYRRMDLPRRTRLLARLLPRIGPLAALGLAGGVFAKFAVRADAGSAFVTTEDAARISSAQVHALIRYLEQSDPSLFDQIATLLARDQRAVSLLSGSLLALVLADLHRRWRARASRRDRQPAEATPEGVNRSGSSRPVRT